MVSTKEKIIDAGIELFSEKGYSETSMRDIAAAVEIKPASIYNHFKSKTEILDDILNEYIEYVKENTVKTEEIDELIDNTDVKTILDRMFFVFTPEKAVRYSKILKIITHEQFREPKATEFVRDIMFTRNENYIKEVLDKLVSAGKIKAVPTEIYARILVSLTISTSTELMFYGFEGYQQRERVSRRTCTAFIINQLLPQET